METQLPQLIEILTLEKVGAQDFIGQNMFIGSPNVYGGQVLGQAISAAHATVGEDRTLHSIHSYFISPGDHDIPIFYNVEKIKDGKVFQTRRVVAKQNGREIFILSASFHKYEEGIEHQAIMPNVARPESLTSFSDLFAEFAEKFRIEPRGIFSPQGPFIFHPVEHYDPFKPKARPPMNHTWFRTNGKVEGNDRKNKEILAYASDFNLLITALLPHGLSFFNTPMQIASLDHAMWFHREAKVDDWLLYVVESTNANAGRAFCTGKIFSKDGHLIASTAQEGLIRKL
ncbi:MAG: acyl-CoA thioesterase II [Saprospiraceae bacterium]|nr:acyl-CoA thioesterase II [Saprospiraceae bacterium]